MYKLSFSSSGKVRQPVCKKLSPPQQHYVKLFCIELHLTSQQVWKLRVQIH